MKTLAKLFCLLVGLTGLAAAQTPAAKKHQVVLQMNVDGADSWNQLLGNINNVQTAFGADNVAIEVVAYGKGLSQIGRAHV